MVRGNCPLGQQHRPSPGASGFAALARRKSREAPDHRDLPLRALPPTQLLIQVILDLGRTENLLGLEIYGLLSRVGQVLTSAVVRLEDTKRFAILSDHFAANSPNPITDSIGWSDEELTGRKLLHQDFTIGAVSEVLNPVRQGHDVAVADSPDLHDLHGAVRDAQDVSQVEIRDLLTGTAHTVSMKSRSHPVYVDANSLWYEGEGGCAGPTPVKSCPDGRFFSYSIITQQETLLPFATVYDT